MRLSWYSFLIIGLGILFRFTFYADSQTVDEVNPGTVQLASIDEARSTYPLDLAPQSSSGYRDTSFEYDISQERSDSTLSIKTNYPRSMQYTLSNLDGKIIKRKRFRQEDILSLGNLGPGHYALYFFAGTQVVKAELVSIEES